MADDLTPATQPEAPSLPTASDGSVILQDPHGRLQTVSPDEADQAIAQGGYTPADPAKIEAAKESAHYKSAPQKLLTAAESIAKIPTLGFSPLLERGFGFLTGNQDLASGKSIIQREKANPLTSFGGTALGFGVPIGGAAGLISKAGEAGAEALGFTGATLGSRVAGAATKAAIESALVQGTDEVFHAMANDPNTVGVAATNIGLAGLLGLGLGTGIGAGSELWNVTKGSKVGQILSAIKNKTSGIEDPASTAIEQAITSSNVPVPDGLKEVIKNNPLAKDLFLDLRESPTRSGLKASDNLRSYQNDLKSELASSFGKDADDLQNLSKLSDHQSGTEAQSHLSSELEASTKSALSDEAARKQFELERPAKTLDALGIDEAKAQQLKELGASKNEQGTNLKSIFDQEVRSKLEPTEEILNNVQSQFKDLSIDAADKEQIRGGIQRFIDEQGYGKAAFAGEGEFANSILEAIDKQDNLADLKKLNSQIGKEASRRQMGYVGGNLKSIIDDVIHAKVEAKLAGESSDLLNQYSLSRVLYRDNMTSLEGASKRLNLGKVRGKESFLEKLSSMRGEDIAKKLSRTNDVGLLNLLKEEFPQTAGAVKDIQLSNLLEGSMEKSPSGKMGVDPDKLVQKVSGLSPEMKEFALPEGAAERLQGIQDEVYKPKTENEIQAKEIADQLNSKLKLGKFDSPSEFLASISKIDPEVLLRKLNQPEAVSFLSKIADQFPNTFKTLKDYQLSALFKEAGGDDFSVQKFFTKFNKLQPEVREMLLPGEMADRVASIEKIHEIIQKLPENYSKTTPFWQRLNKHMPAALIGALGTIAGIHPLVAIMIGELFSTLGKEVPDAAKLSLLKFLDSPQATNPSAFKGMIDMYSAALKGENAIGKGVSYLVKGASATLPSSLVHSWTASPQETEKLDKKLKELQKDPRPLMKTGGTLGIYAPDHQTALSQVSANAVNYLNSSRPDPQKLNPLDSEPKVSKPAEAAFQRKLEIASKPLIVLKAMKEGNLTPEDVQTLKMTSPGTYQRISQNMINQVIESSAKGEQIPYRLRLNMGLFLGQPLDSTMTPEGILSHQLMNSQMAGVFAQPQQKVRTSGPAPKLPAITMTPGQAAEASHLRK